MKRLFSFLIVLMLGIFFLKGQNLVNNYSLENYSTCPNGASAIPQAISWNTARNSPEYLHGCSTGIYSDTPTNYFGYQLASTGVAYGGGLFYGSFAGSYLPDLREYFYVTLSSPLVIGTTYYVSFKINLCDNSPFAINKAGIQFCNTYTSSYPLTNSAHVYTNAVVSDKVNWTTVVGSIVPSVAYNALMVGNFFQDVNCTVVNTGTPITIGYHGYYFIDDVVVSTTPIVLPITWGPLNADVNGNVATVSWEFSENDIDFFALESSDDGQIFREAHVMPATAGSYSYSQLDTMRNHMPTTFYRVRAVTQDGNTHLSPVVEAKRYEAGIDFLLAYPSPVKSDGILTVEYNSNSAQAAEMQFITLDGRIVRTEPFPEGELGHHEMSIYVQGLSPGAYILKAGSLTRKFMVVE